MARKIVKVCVSESCCQRGSRSVFDVLERDPNLEADVSVSQDCFRFCKKGPNVAVDGNVIHFVRPSEAARRVRQEITHPSPRVDVLGMRSIDDLDTVLDNLDLL